MTSVAPTPSSREAGTATLPTLAAPARPASRDRRSAWITLAVGLMLTSAATLYLKSRVELIAAQEFTAQCNVIQHDINHRLVEHARILLSGVALFAVSDTVTREEWHVFTDYQKIDQQLPGIQGIGFSLLIPRGELARHVLDIRRNGFPAYTVKPAGDREVYSSIIYLEPFTGRNLQAFGYDMFSDPVRRAAMERARDTNTATLSGKVVLVQETGVDVQAGTLMYAPVYRKKTPLETVTQRRAALQGWVYSPYRMNDLLLGILHDRTPGQSKHLHLQIFEGAQPLPQNLLYKSPDAGDEKLRHDVRFTRQVPVDFDGQCWTLHFTQNGSGYFTEQYLGVWLTMVGGVTITLLLFALIRTLLDTRAEAQRIAEMLTLDLRENEQFTADIVDSLTSSIAVIDSNGIIVAVNKSWRYFALDNNHSSAMSTGIGLRYLDAIKVNRLGEDADGAEAAFTGIQAVMQGEQDIFTLEYPCHFPGGQRWFSMSVSKLNGAHRGAVISHTDITDRKQVQEALQDKSALVNTLLEAMPAPVFYKDTGGLYVGINKAFEELWGKTREEMVGKSVFDTAPRELAEIYHAKDDELFRNPGLQVYEAHVTDALGNLRDVVFRKATYEDCGGKVLGMIGMIIDVTERNLLDRVLQEKNIELDSARSVADKANLAKSEFLSSMSHELRSPLNSILGFAQLLKSDITSPTPDQKESIDRILRAGWHLLTLINEILDLAKIESGRELLSLEPVSLNEVILECQDMMAPQAQQHGLRMIILPVDTHCFVQADRTRLKQVLINLLANAIKYNRVQGTVEVDCIGSAPGRVRVSVRDTGAGLDAEQVAQLFQAFNRLGQEASSKEGTGIGLVLTRHLIELMGGIVGVDSTVGIGSVFWFELIAVAGGE